MMYQHFMRDGTVHINLGEKPWTPAEKEIPKYMEEYMAEGAPYFKALYHWSTNGEKSVVEDLMRLVVQAKELIHERFALPVPVGGNLSPVMRLMKALYLTQ